MAEWSLMVVAGDNPVHAHSNGASVVYPTAYSHCFWIFDNQVEFLDVLKSAVHYRYEDDGGRRRRQAGRGCDRLPADEWGPQYWSSIFDFIGNGRLASRFFSSPEAVAPKSFEYPPGLLVPLESANYRSGPTNNVVRVNHARICAYSGNVVFPELVVDPSPVPLNLLDQNFPLFDWLEVVSLS